MNETIKVSICQQLPFQSIPRSAEWLPPDTPWHPSAIAPPRSESPEKAGEGHGWSEKTWQNDMNLDHFLAISLLHCVYVKGISCGDVWNKVILSGNWRKINLLNQHCLAAWFISHITLKTKAEIPKILSQESANWLKKSQSIGLWIKKSQLSLLKIEKGKSTARDRPPRRDLLIWIYIYIYKFFNFFRCCSNCLLKSQLRNLEPCNTTITGKGPWHAGSHAYLGENGKNINQTWEPNQFESWTFVT